MIHQNGRINPGCPRAPLRRFPLLRDLCTVYRENGALSGAHAVGLDVAWAAAGNSVGDGDGIGSEFLTEFPRVSGLLTPFAAGHGVGGVEVSAGFGEYHVRSKGRILPCGGEAS